MGEVIRDKYRGRGVGFVQIGAAFGPGLAALVYAGLYAVLPEAIAWRVLFAVGILPALLVLWIRRSIPESEAFRGRDESGARPGIAQLFSAFRGPYLWLTIKVSLMVMGSQGGVWSVGFWMATYLRTERHLNATGAGLYVTVQQFGALIGFLLGAYLADAIRLCGGGDAARYRNRGVLDFGPYADDRHAAAAPPGDARPRHREPRGRGTGYGGI